MAIENIIYIYMYMCISLVFFDVSYMIVKARNDRKIQNNKRVFHQPIKEQIVIIQDGGNVSEKHKKYLLKKLKHVSYLSEFTNALDELEGEEDINKYLYEIHIVFAELAMYYKERPDMEKAYFAYIISKHNFCKIMVQSPLINVMLEFLKEKSIYCRENAMKAIYSFGDANLLVDAIKILDGRGSSIHKKLLTDGILSFSGNHNELSKILWENFERFSDQIKVVIVDYFRFAKQDFREELFTSIKKEDIFIELKYSIIRYYGSLYYEPAKNILIDFIKNTDISNWEIVAISETAISLYKDSDTIELLKSMLCSRNWYIRLNAAKSLVRIGISQEDIDEIVNGNDKYAKEILIYCLLISESK